MADVRRIQVSGGSDGNAEGGNSAYLLPDRGVLVDPGPPTESAWDRLHDGITAAGLALADIDHVLVTHWHADHTGNAARLHEAADATLAMHAHDAPLVADYAAERERRLDRDAATLERWGVPADQIATLVDFDSPSPVPDSVPVRELTDGGSVAGIEVVHTPGHTAGHAAFVLDDVGFVGDAVLRTCTPNVGGGDTRQDDPLTAYRRTLSRLEARVEAVAESVTSGMPASRETAATGGSVVTPSSDTANDSERPRVAVLDWLDPVMVAGHWVPELVELAGGAYHMEAAGAHSRPREWSELREYDPEVLVVSPCGFELPQVRQNLDEVTDRPGWDQLTAVQRDKVYLVDGHHYVNRAGPRLVDTLEYLAAMISPAEYESPPTGAVERLDASTG